MDSMRFIMFNWPNNPEHFEIFATREPRYKLDEDGEQVFDSLSPLFRIFSGKGVFFGEAAAEHFNALQVLLAAGIEGELYHPVWGTTTAYLTELKLEQESRPDYVVYSFVFHESDESGRIPYLPEWEDKYK